MKNNIHRMVACALSLALLPLCFLSSCKDNGQGDMTSTGDDSTGTPEPQVLTVVDKSEAKLTVVRPEADPGATTRFAKALRTKLNNYFKAEFPFSDDWYDPSISSITPITESYEHTVAQLEGTPITSLHTGEQFCLQLSGLVKENIQARDRGARLIAAASAAFGGAFSCNSNKAEMAVGYATFYGDICGAVAMIGDLWKHQVYALGHYLNDVIFKREIIPEEIFTIRPSAELSETQTVGRGGDPLVYAYHDYLLRAFIENWHKTTPADVLRWYVRSTLAEELGCTQQAIEEACPTPAAFVADLERWWKLFAGFAVAKRIQAPPILSLTKRAFGYDHREAQLSPYFSREYQELKKQLLEE